MRGKSGPYIYESCILLLPLKVMRILKKEQYPPDLGWVPSEAGPETTIPVHMVDLGGKGNTKGELEK